MTLVKDHFNYLEKMRMKLDYAREYLRRVEDSFEMGRFAQAEAMTVIVILHLKRMLRDLSERRTASANWIT